MTGLGPSPGAKGIGKRVSAAPMFLAQRFPAPLGVFFADIHLLLAHRRNLNSSRYAGGTGGVGRYPSDLDRVGLPL
jgi:hypothetical protein